eukprot:5466096-Pyramimonas_sp.AAC.1
MPKRGKSAVTRHSETVEALFERRPICDSGGYAGRGKSEESDCASNAPSKGSPAFRSSAWQEGTWLSNRGTARAARQSRS